MKISAKIKELTTRAQELAFPGEDDTRFVSLCIVIDDDNGDFVLTFDKWNPGYPSEYLDILGNIVVAHSSLAKALDLLDDELYDLEDAIEVEIVKDGRTYRLVK